MSVLIFVDQSEGLIKKSSYEALTYGVKVAELTGVDAEAIVLGTVTDELSALGRFGVKKVYHINKDLLNQLDTQVYAGVIAEVANTSGAKIVVMSHNMTGRAIVARVAARLKAGLVAGAIALPDTSKGFVVKKNVFSGKALASINILTPVKVISLSPNSFAAISGEGLAQVTELNIPVATPRVKVTAIHKISGEVPLTEASIVVSGGRGLKGPENWGIIEDLAHVLHAATACSRPVADANWRPHHEHVGQTGIQIAPDLYFAIGISGAIQHLAGVNRSKIIVVINKDAEAPFFKAADYGIVGDAFEVVPQLTALIKKMKGI